MSAFPNPAERQPVPLPASDVAPETHPAAIDGAGIYLRQAAGAAALAPDERSAAMLERARAIHGELGTPDDWILVTSDIYISALEKARDYYRHRAEHDMLTGLVNKETWRNLLRTRLELGQPTGVVMLDLDRFKAVNDTLGHATGDVLLADFGTYLRGLFKREEDLITDAEDENENTSPGTIAGRDGGDEFRILVDLSENNRRGEEPHARMDRTYEYLSDHMARFVATQPEAIRALGFNVSIGAAVSNPDSQLAVDEQMDILLDQADESMYEAKPDGGRR